MTQSNLPGPAQTNESKISSAVDIQEKVNDETQPDCQPPDDFPLSQI